MNCIPCSLLVFLFNFIPLSIYTSSLTLNQCIMMQIIFNKLKISIVLKNFDSQKEAFILFQR